MPAFSPTPGTLLTAGSLNPTDWPIESVDVSRIPWRDGVQGLENQRKHLTLSQLSLTPHGGVACFYAGPFKAAADAYPLDTPELRKLALEAYREGWAQVVKDGLVTPGLGGRIADGVDAARRALNAKMPAGRQVRSYRGTLPRFDRDNATEIAFYRAQSLGWQLVVGRYVDAAQAKDVLDDGIVQADAKPVGETYGHCFDLYDRGLRRGDLGGTYAVNDNYAGVPGARNSYLLDDFEEKVRLGMMFPSCFYFLPA